MSWSSHRKAGDSVQPHELGKTCLLADHQHASGEEAEYGRCYPNGLGVSSRTLLNPTVAGLGRGASAITPKLASEQVRSCDCSSPKVDSWLVLSRE